MKTINDILRSLDDAGISAVGVADLSLTGAPATIVVVGERVVRIDWAGEPTSEHQVEAAEIVADGDPIVAAIATRTS